MVLLVADGIPQNSKELLRDNGWSYLDRRGHLWFTADGIRINDTELAPIPRDNVTTHPRPPISGQIGLGIGLHLLMHPTQPVVSEVQHPVNCASFVERGPVDDDGVGELVCGDRFERLVENARVDSAGEATLPPASS